MKGKRVLITGAGGFIPSHVVEAFVSSDAGVRALVHYNSRSDVGNLRFVPPGMSPEVEIIFGDVRDQSQIYRVMDGCDLVVHMAALIGIPYSYVAPSSYIDTNIRGTLNVLEGARMLNTPHVIITSTSEVYGTALYEPIDEKHPLQPQSPYSASKISADMLAESYYRSFDLPVTILRPFNTFGPRQSARAVIPTVISQALSDRKEIRLGSLHPKRDMTYVEDTARAFLLAGQKGPSALAGKIIHFGTGVTRTVGEIARLALAACGSSAGIVTQDERVRPDKSEVGILVCNAQRARELLGWEPLVSFEEGLERTVRFISGTPESWFVDTYVI